MGRLLLFVVVVVVLSLAIAFVLAALPWLKDNELALSSLVLLPAAAGATALLLTISDRRPPAAICLPMDGLAWRHLAFGAVVGVGLSVSIIGLQWAAGWVEIQYGAIEGSLTEVMWAPSLGVGFFVMASAASAEELLFRGYGLQQLMRGTHPGAAVILSSVVFGLVHASNPNSSTVGVVNTALFGMLFGLPLLRQRSLWIPAGMHFGWNFSLACLGANVSGLTIRLTGLEIVPVGPAVWSGAEYGPEASLLTSFAVVAAAVLLWRLPLRANEAPVLWDPEPPLGSGEARRDGSELLHLGIEARTERKP
jgi:CAAX protease family protein